MKMVSGKKRNDSNNGRSLKVRYFPGARIADMKHYSVPLLMKQPERIILLIGTNDALVLTPENMFKELKELRDFILLFVRENLITRVLSRHFPP